VAPDSTDTRARTALTLGLLRFLFSVLGRKALKDVNAAEGALRGRWAAWTGIVHGCLSVAVLIMGWTYLRQHG
jgi:hypothetical protein